MSTYGFIGLGSMGTPMAVQLAEHCSSNGHRLLVWNRSQGKDVPIIAAGAAAVANPAALVAASSVVVVMLPDLPQLLELTDGPTQLLAGVQDPTVLAVCSSVSPQAVRTFADHVTALTNGLVQVIDAPVSGGTEGATEGTLAIMVGGTESAVSTAWPALTAMGTTVRHLGPVGSGALAKACNQMVVAATMIALSEASALAESAGVSVTGLLDILAGGFGASRVLEVKTVNLTSNTYAPTGKAVYMVKDLSFVEVEARLTGTPLPQASLSLDLYKAVADAELGDQDVSVVHELIRRRGRQIPRSTVE
jgi:3-hydroxyisobutyrate dehydrogenase-like beta-hydroxyacid dehydrogenase